jgi:DNA polymerase III subunit delta
MPKKTSIEHYKKALADLKSEKRKPVYFFCGEEQFFLDKLQEHVMELLPPEHRDFNLDLLYGRDVTPEKVLSIVRSFPMMAERRVVVVRDFQELSPSNAPENDYGGSINDFIPYLEQPNPSTLLVCIDPKKPAGNTKLGKAVQKNSNVGFFEFESMPDYRLPEWIMEWIRQEHDREIAPEAAQMLAQYVGNSLQLLSTEIDKVCTFVDSPQAIEEKHIKKIIGLYREYTVFDLKDTLVSRNLEQSLFIAEQMLHQSKSDTGEVIRTVGFFYNVFSNVWQIKRLAATGNTKKQVQQALGVSSSWYFNKLWKDASKFELHEMPRIFETLLDADRSAKGFSTLDPASIFLLMIKRIIN